MSRPCTAAPLATLVATLRNIAVGALCAGMLAAPMQGQASAPRDPSPHSDAVLVSGAAGVEPGKTATVAIRLTLDAGWHTYWINPGDAGLPLKVKWTLPTGVTAGPLLFPTPRLTPQAPLMSYGYETAVYLLAEVQVPANAADGSTLHLEGKADWLACADVCLPATGPLSLDIPVRGGTAATTEHARNITATRAALPVPAAAWRTYAWATPTGYIITAVADGDAPATPAPYFFVDSANVIDHAKPQGFVRHGDTLVFSLARAENSKATASTLRGIVTGNTADSALRSRSIAASVTASVPAAFRARAIAMLDDSTARQVGGVTATATESAPAVQLPDPTADMTLIVAIAFAFLGGLILNLMPCVFPVLSVKVLALLEHGGAADGSRGRKHGLAFGAGVLASFWLLAGVLMALRAGGASLGWGFQLQSPPVVAALALLMFALGLNLSGVFEIGLSLTRLGGAGSGGSYRDSLLTGGLAVLVAAPCTAPFMGAALGYALVQPAIVGLLVFTALAIGLALPFVVLASVPQLLRFLPRPGPWLESLKQFFAFPMYATVVWLLWVFGQQVGVDALAILLLSMIVLALGAWLWARGVRTASTPVRAGAGALALLAFGVAVTGDRTSGGAPTASARSIATGSGSWEPWSAARVAALRAEGRPVFIDFTAAWCLSCQVNERVALRTTAVTDAFARGNVALLRADWTSRDDAITQVLAGFGRSGVPLYVLYPAGTGGAATILPAVLTPGMVVSAVQKAAPTTVGSAVR